MVREVRRDDLPALLALYTHLHDNPVPDPAPEAIWETILADPNHHIFVYETEGRLVSSCVAVLVPNLTHRQQPYLLVENVVTHADYRKRGYAGACLRAARDLAERTHCYKIMLLTGSRKESTLRFYEQNGFDRTEKTGMIQRL